MPHDSYSHPSTLSWLTKQPHFPLGHVLLQNLDLLSMFGLRDPLEQRLGSGSFGSAYEVPLRKRSVLKLTRDPTEVQASSLLLGKTSKRIVRIYGVWALDGTFGEGLRGWYAVHRDLLSPLNKRDSAIVEAIFQIYGDTSLDLVIPRSMKQRAMLDKWRGLLRQETVGGGVFVSEDGGPTAPLGSGKLVQRAVQLLIEIGQGIDEMHRAGVDWEDVHSGNIMRDADKQLVIADVGWGLMHEDFDREIPFLTTDIIRGYLDAALALDAAGKH